MKYIYTEIGRSNWLLDQKCLSVPHNYFENPTKLFSDLYPAKFSDTSTKPVHVEIHSKCVSQFLEILFQYPITIILSKRYCMRDIRQFFKKISKILKMRHQNIIDYDKKFISKTSRSEFKHKRNSMQQVRGRGCRLIVNSHECTAVRNRGRERADGNPWRI